VTLAETTPKTGLQEALLRLDEAAPGAPLLALGQTVLWDEPMKGGLALLAAERSPMRGFVAGVHDTDYFAKLPLAPQGRDGRFRAVPHNDTTTKDLWSAAGEFSALFGSETVISKSDFLRAGLRVATVLQSRSSAMDEASEAWRWRGIVSLEDEASLAMEVPLDQLFHVLYSTLEWALDETLASLAEPERQEARAVADRLLSLLCDHAETSGSETLSGFYRNLLPDVYRFAAGKEVPLEATATSELLRFTRETAGLPRFELADYFVRPETRDLARGAYDEAIREAEIYELARFGTGAIPFDLVIPGYGRGTIRLGTRGAVIQTREPVFLSFKKPISSLRELAEAVVAKFGDRCILIGKAVTLIGMLAREFVFVFHEGASGYVRHSRRFHDLMAERGLELAVNPILRVRYRPWDTLQACCSWLRLPEPLRTAFGTEELGSPSFAVRWRQVADEQKALLEELGRLRRPLDLIRFLEDRIGGAWQALAREYEGLHDRLEGLSQKVEALRSERHRLYEEVRALRQSRVQAEIAKGEHWRAKFFEKSPTSRDEEQRALLAADVDRCIREIEEVKAAISEVKVRQEEVVSAPEVGVWHGRRRAIELEAELKRMRLIRQAVVASKGLERAGRRPSAWWFPVVCPKGQWFRETIRQAEAYLEPLRS
jgi:hypothetical protein